MSIIFLLLLLSSCTFSVLSAGDDGSALLKIKEQLGNPEILNSWVEGVNFCDGSGNVDAHVYITCTDSGRVNSLNFYFFYTPFSPFPEAICDLTELQMLFIERVYIHGPIPSCISKLVNLREFTMRRTFLSSPVPEFLNHKSLTLIDLSSSALYGPIPPSLSAIPNLQILDLSSNGLNGTIPLEFLRHPPALLYLSNNWLSGELPKCSEWGNFSTIDISNNLLSGDASFFFGKQKTVNSINLSNNQFEFDLSYVEIPENLRYLDLSFNKIYGKVPESLVWHPVLSTLYLMSNRLCGEIPQGGNMSQYPSDDFMGNACLCGSPLPPCFDLAPSSAPAPPPPPAWKP